MKKYFKLFIFIIIIIFSPRVFASTTYNLTNKIVSAPGESGGTFLGYDISSGIVVPTFYNTGTRYNGVLNQMIFFIKASDWNWQYNKTYTITLSMATEDWRNHFMGPIIEDCSSASSCSSNSYTKYVNGSFRFISQKKISFNIKTGNTMLTYLKVTLYSGSGTTGMTGVTNFNLSNVSITQTTTSTPTPVPSTPTPTPAPTLTPQPNNQDIINNQNQNTQDIINNNNVNTNSIINNQNQNNQDLIDSNSQNTSDIIENSNNNTQDIVEHINDNSTCPSGDLQLDTSYKDVDGYLNSSGVITSHSNYVVSPYLKIKPNTQYKVNVSLTTSTAYFCLYNSSKEIVSCTSYASSSRTFTTNSETYYMRLSIRNGRVVTVNGPVCNDWQKEAMEKLKDVNQSIYDTLSDNSNPNIQDNEFTSLFNTVSITNPLDSLLQLPVQFINAIVNQSNSCQVVNLGTLLGVSITLPCIDISSIIGSSVWNTIDVLSSIGLIVLILKQLYESITNALTLGGYMDAKKGGLGYMSPLEFLSSIFTGFGGDI